MKLLIQPFMPLRTPGGASHDLIAGEFNVDDDNVVGQHNYGTLVIRRSEIFASNILPDDFDLSNLPDDVLILN